MGEKYIIKNEDGKEVAYERGIFGDRKIGELHEKWDGSKETRNVFKENVKVEKPSIWGERKAEVDGQKGVFRESFFEGHPTFKSGKSADSRVCSYSTASSTASPATTSEVIGGLAGIIVLAIIIIAGIGYLTGSSDKTGEANKEQIQISQQELSLNGLKYTVQVKRESSIPVPLEQWFQENRNKLNSFDSYEIVIVDVGNDRPIVGEYYALYQCSDGVWSWSNGIPSELSLKIGEIMQRARKESDAQNKISQQETSIKRRYYPIYRAYRVVLIPQSQERSFLKEGVFKKSASSGSSPLVGAEARKQQIVTENAPPDIPKDIPSPKHSVVASQVSSQTLLLNGENYFGLSWWVEDELHKNSGFKKTLVDLATGIYEQTGNSINLVDWFQKGENLWAVGSFGGDYPRGIICHSPNNGKTWTRQWQSAAGIYQQCQAIGIYFSDSNEGWVLLLGGILHTTDGGVTWREISENKQLIFHNLFVLDKKRLAVSSQPLYCFNYTEDGGLSWKRFKEGEKEYDTLLAELEKTFNIEITRLRYGKIYVK